VNKYALLDTDFISKTYSLDAVEEVIFIVVDIFLR